MNDCYVLFTVSWCLLFLLDSNTVLASTKLSKVKYLFGKGANIKHNNLKNVSMQEEQPFYFDNIPLMFHNDNSELYSGIDQSMFMNGSDFFYDNLNTRENQQDLTSKLAVILSNEPYLLKNLSAMIGNKSGFACKPLGMKNSSDLGICCCSKDMEQKCEGVDLTFLLPIPGDNSTTTVASDKCASPTQNCSMPTNPTVCPQFIHNARNASRGYRKAEESTLDALKRLQLTHGIFAPNELEMEKAIEKARIELPKEKKLPIWLNDLKNKNVYSKTPRQRSYLIGAGKENEGKNINDSFISPFKTEDKFNEGNINLRPELISSPSKHLSLLAHNADTIRKQLETIRQYDILLANIRAQAQLKLVELADIEAKHHLEEVRFNSERDKSLKELNNVKEMLKEEVKLAQRLPYNKWREVQNDVDPTILNLKLNDADLRPQNLEDGIANSEINQEVGEMDNKLLEDLENALHESINYQDPYVDVKPDYGKLANDNTFMKLSLLNKALSRTVREFRAANENNTSDTVKRIKRKCSININTNNNNKRVGYKDQIFQTDFVQPKDVFSRTKLSSDLNSGQLVQVKISDLTNCTANRNSKKHIMHNNNIINQQKNKLASKNTS